MDFGRFEDTLHTVFVEHCVGCENHQETTRHVVAFRCSSRGCGFETDHEKDWSEHLARHRLVANKGSSICQPLVTTKYDKYIEMFKQAVRANSSNIEVCANAHGQPRIGSFEIYCCGESGRKIPLFSKLKTKSWPQITIVANKVRVKLREEHIAQLETATVRHGGDKEQLKQCFFGNFESEDNHEAINECSREDFLRKVKQRRSLERFAPSLESGLKRRATITWEDVLLVLLRQEPQPPPPTISGHPRVAEMDSSLATAEPKQIVTSQALEKSVEASKSSIGHAKTKSSPSIRSLDIDYELRPGMGPEVETTPSVPSEKASFDEVPSEVSYQSSIPSEITGEYSDDFD